MAYTRKTWKNGEVILAQHLNNLEEGVAEANKTAAAADVTAYQAQERADIAWESAEGARSIAGEARTVATGAYSAAAAAEKKHNTRTVSLAVESWSSLAQTVTVSGVKANNTVVCAPAPESHEAYCNAGVYCSAQAAGTLTFKCKTKPTVALTVNVMIMGG